MYSTNSGLAVPFVKRVLETKNGDVFVLSGENEIKVLLEGRVGQSRHHQHAGGVGGTFQGAVVSVGAELFRFSRDSLVPYEFTNGRRPELWWVFNLAPGRDDSIWVACVNGICRVKNGAFQQWTQKDGLADGNVPLGSAKARWHRVRGHGHGHRPAKRTNSQPPAKRWSPGNPTSTPSCPMNVATSGSYTLRGLFLLNKQNVDDFFGGRIDHVECAAYEIPRLWAGEFPPAGHCTVASGFPVRRG